MLVKFKPTFLKDLEALPPSVNFSILNDFTVSKTVTDLRQEITASVLNFAMVK
jgi:hypothetical protein